MPRHFCAVALTAALVSISAFVTFSVSAEEIQSSFRVEESELDLGTIVAGTIATATFVFYNDGPDDVHIIRAKPS